MTRRPTMPPRARGARGAPAPQTGRSGRSESTGARRRRGARFRARGARRLSSSRWHDAAARPSADSGSDMTAAVQRKRTLSPETRRTIIAGDRRDRVHGVRVRRVVGGQPHHVQLDPVLVDRRHHLRLGLRRGRAPAWWSRTPRRASSTSPRARSACSWPTCSGSCRWTGGCRRSSRSMLTVFVAAPIMGALIERVLMRAHRRRAARRADRHHHRSHAGADGTRRPHLGPAGDAPHQPLLRHERVPDRRHADAVVALHHHRRRPRPRARPEDPALTHAARCRDARGRRQPRARRRSTASSPAASRCSRGRSAPRWPRSPASSSPRSSPPSTCRRSRC